MAEILLREATGLPDGAHVSLRVGDVRRQMPYKEGGRFRFDEAPEKFTLDIFQRVGSAEVSAADLAVCAAEAAGQPPSREGAVEVPLLGGETLRLGLRVGPPAARRAPPASKGKEKVAAKALSYLEGNGVQSMLQEMVHELLDAHPSDPLGFMIRHLQGRSGARPAPKPPAGRAPGRASGAARGQKEPQSPKSPKSPRSSAAGRRGSGDAAPAKGRASVAAPAKGKAGGDPPEGGKKKSEAGAPATKTIEAALAKEGPAPAAPAAAPSAEDKPAGASPSSPAQGEADGGSASDDVGAESDDDDGFPSDVCPDELPDLSAHHNLCATTLRADPALYAALRERRTPLGVGLACCVKTGMENPAHPMVSSLGIVAGDEFCYDVFAELFDRVIAARAPPRPPAAAAPAAGPLDPEGRHLVSVFARASRNFAGLRFPPACSMTERRECERLAVRGLMHLSGILEGTYEPLPGSDSFPLRLGGMDGRTEAELRRLGMLMEEPDAPVLISSGYSRDWPDARGVFVSEDRTFFALVNDENHVRLDVAEEGQDLAGACRKLSSALSTIEASAQEAAGRGFARSARLGVLTSCPSSLGAGLSLGAFVALPALGRQPEDLHALCDRFGVHARPARGGRWASALSGGALYEVAGVGAVGLDEAGTVAWMSGALWALLDAERGLEESRGGSRSSPAAAEPEAAPAATTPAEGVGQPTEDPTEAPEAVATEAPAPAPAEPPAAESPAAESPAAESPAPKSPAAESLAAESPAEESPAEEAPAEDPAEAPEAAATEAPGPAPAEPPKAESPAAESPAAESPAAESPAEEAPTEEAPAEEAPAAADGAAAAGGESGEESKEEQRPPLGGAESHAAEVLAADPSIRDRLRGARTRHGATLDLCLLPAGGGPAGPREVGAVAGDAECYGRFAAFFDPLLRSLRGDAHEEELLAPLDFAAGTVAAVRVRGRRNVDGFRFSPTMCAEERLEVERLLSGVLRNFAGDLAGEYHPLSTLEPSEVAEVEAADPLLSDVLEGAPGVGSADWPEARGVFHAMSGGLAACINAEDHLSLWAAQRGTDVAAPLRRLRAAEDAVAEELRNEGRRFARSAAHGLLAACPSEAGSGVRLEVAAVLPKLRKQPDFEDVCRDAGLQVRSQAAECWLAPILDGRSDSVASQVEVTRAGLQRLVDAESGLA